MDMDTKIKSEYSKALKSQSEHLAGEVQALCTAERYDTRYLEKIPRPILDNDFGCGNPSRYVREGDAVLDLGSGSGKICYILSQIVGPGGRVFGIDFNPDMVALARSQQDAFADTIGFDNMRFSQASITDLKVDLEKLDRLLGQAGIDSLEKLRAFERRRDEIFTANPLIPDASIDVVVSNCVINLVGTGDKHDVFREMFRILRPGGRIAISDNVSNIEVPAELQADADLWTACYAGVFQEQAFYRAIEAVGFEGLRIEVRHDDPAKTVGDVMFRSVTVTAVKPVGASAQAAARAVMYRGPWLEVVDESGVRLHRGEVSTVPAALAGKLGLEAYAGDVAAVDGEAAMGEAPCCAPAAAEPASCCGPEATAPAAASGCCG